MTMITKAPETETTPQAKPAKATKVPKATKVAKAPEPVDDGGGTNIKTAEQVGETREAIDSVRLQRAPRAIPTSPKPAEVAMPKPPLDERTVEPEADEVDDSPEPEIGEQTLVRAIRAGLDMDDIRGMSEAAIGKVLARIEAGPAPVVPKPETKAEPGLNLSTLAEMDPEAAKTIGEAFSKLQSKLEALESQVVNKGYRDPVERFAAEREKEYGFLLGDGTDNPSNAVNRNAVRDHLRLLTAGRQAAGLPEPPDVSQLVKQAVHAVHAEAILRHQQSGTSDRLRSRKGQFIGHSKAGSTEREAATLSPRDRAIRNVAGKLRSFGV